MRWHTPDRDDGQRFRAHTQPAMAATKGAHRLRVRLGKLHIVPLLFKGRCWDAAALHMASILDLGPFAARVAGPLHDMAHCPLKRANDVQPALCYTRRPPPIAPAIPALLLNFSTASIVTSPGGTVCSTSGRAATAPHRHLLTQRLRAAAAAHNCNPLLRRPVCPLTRRPSLLNELLLTPNLTLLLNEAHTAASPTPAAFFLSRPISRRRAKPHWASAAEWLS